MMEFKERLKEKKAAEAEKAKLENSKTTNEEEASELQTSNGEITEEATANGEHKQEATDGNAESQSSETDSSEKPDHSNTNGQIESHLHNGDCATKNESEEEEQQSKITNGVSTESQLKSNVLMSVNEAQSESAVVNGKECVKNGCSGDSEKQAEVELLGDIVVHFPVSQEEVTLSMSSFKVTFKTFCEEENNCIKGMNTELMLYPDEFDYFQVGEDSAVTFCLKELRGLLSFAESYSLPVSSQFGVAGQPISFTVKDMALEAHVVLSTLTDPNHESPSRPAPGDDCPVNIPKTSTAEISTCEGPMETEVCVADGEQVASSQGSEVFNPALHMRKMIQLHAPGEIPSLVPESALTTPVTPATFKIRSLLFGAVYSDGGNDKTVDLPSLACASDTEEDGGTEEDLGNNVS
ncbi:cell cycle checkpoint control RAD9A-like protein [Labeo rohita]|uniref:Cell cycle checkpoint control RAD9A-like protein n=1 Tax=Labeo rohita TaxID=84645 RepID=A0A498L486_LABRO|nr:cell cycle checkpoint control RAD9A-like protein [Labeo rohita]